MADSANGHTNGSINGSINGMNTANGAPRKPIQRKGSAASATAPVQAMQITLKDLSVEVDREGSLLNMIKKKLGLGKVAVEAEQKPVEMIGQSKDTLPLDAAENPGILRLVKCINTVIHPGSVTAIMGSSGAGKTTLLNAIAARLSGSARPTGQLFFNELDVVPLRKKGRGQRTAYVKQEDALLPYLTVRETLRYNAELRLPSSMPTKTKHALVEEIILELNLKECASTVIGTASSTSSSSRGCSSGERRLVSIAIQLLSSPSLLLLDEPTSSLDSFTSYSLCQTLASIASEQNRTVVMSVHQPRYSSFALFDNLILLCKGGHLVYSGPANKVKEYFENLLGVEMDKEMNPADWILDLSSVDYSSQRKEKESKERLEFLAKSWKERYVDRACEAKDGASERARRGRTRSNSSCV
jgi:ABC-type multidrug transport system ATPase subunit